MPPKFQPGWTLEFDAPLTEPRHNLVVEYLTMLNKVGGPERALWRVAAE